MIIVMTSLGLTSNDWNSEVKATARGTGPSMALSVPRFATKSTTTALSSSAETDGLYVNFDSSKKSLSTAFESV